MGRTGRAGNKGTAITFIGPDEDRYAPDLVKALRESGAVVPQDLLVRSFSGGLGVYTLCFRHDVKKQVPPFVCSQVQGQCDWL